MARRPNSGSHKGGKKSKPAPFNRADSKVKKWNQREDIPLDEEDQFHAARDKIMLEDDYGGYEDEDDDEEVFALKGMDVDSDEEEEEEEDLEQDDDEDEDAVPMKKGKGKKKEQDASSSSSEESEVDESWGRGKSAYYASNAAEIDSDDEEANELEEKETVRLQRKTREALTEEDFGLNDARDVTTDDLHDMTDALVPVVPALPQHDAELIKHLERTNPEALALARDWADTAHKVARTKTKIKLVEATADAQTATSLGLVHLYYQALLAYAATLAFYLHLRAGEKYARRPELLRHHPIMGRLLTLKRGLTTLEDLDFAPDLDESDEEGESDGDEVMWDLARSSGLDPEELEELLNDAILGREAPSKSQPESVKKPPKKKQKTSRTESKPAAKHVFDLVEPEFGTIASNSRRVDNTDFLDIYGEATSLQSSDAADKNARRKSLKFHTSKIESASARRQGARNQALGGDDDIPYRERNKERGARLEKEAKARGLGQGGEDLDDEEPPSLKIAETIDSDSENSNVEGYYELVKQNSKAKKAKKKAEYDATRSAERAALRETESSDGPRALTRAILKNKGLTPHRSKSVRNPRVKKRERYEKAKRKVSSQKAVYKGGLAETGGHYGGEKSGISKVIKSVRLA